MSLRKDDTRPSTVYAIRCKETGRLYVGVTVNLEQRIKAHFRELTEHLKADESRTLHPSRGLDYWQADFDKYGEDAFEVYVLRENVPHSERRKEEARYIEKYCSSTIGKGYNTHTEKDYHFTPAILYCEPPSITVIGGDSE